MNKARKQASFQMKPVITYRQPGYPQEGFDLASIKMNNYDRLSPGKQALYLKLAGILSLSLSACVPLTGDIDYTSITESEARALLLEKCAQCGLNITEDIHFSLKNVVFNADGYDEQKLVGYEYLSFTDGEDTSSETALSADEREQLDSWNEHKGPFFLILDQRDYGSDDDRSYEDLFSDLEQDIDEYLQFLKDRGVL